MIPQVISKDFGRFRQYSPNGLQCIGLSDGQEVDAVLVVDPDHQLRYFCYFVDGVRYPYSRDFYAAFGEKVQTPLLISPRMATTVNAPFGESPRGLIIVQMFKGVWQEDSPSPQMDDDVDGRGMSYNSANQAPIATDVPDELELDATFYIQLCRWRELRKVAEPTPVIAGFGRPLTDEDQVIRQYWSRDRIW